VLFFQLMVASLHTQGCSLKVAESGRKQLSESEPKVKDELSARPTGRLSCCEPEAKQER